MSPRNSQKTSKTKQNKTAITTTSNNEPPPATISASPVPTPALSSPPYEPITDNVSIQRLVKLAQDSPPDSVFRIVWQHAFEQGKEIGHSKGTTNGPKIDIDEVLAAYRRGVEKGRD